MVEGVDVVWLGHSSHAGGQPPTDGGTAPLPTPTTRRLQRARGWGPALCTPVPFGPSGSSSPASPAGPLNRLDRRPCTNTRYFSLRLTSAYPCHKLSPASTEGFQACVSREVWVHPRTGKRGPPQLTGGGEPLPRGGPGSPGWATLAPAWLSGGLHRRLHLGTGPKVLSGPGTQGREEERPLKHSHLWDTPEYLQMA